MLFSPLALVAQERFGFFSYSKVLESMSQYVSATEKYDSLKCRCNAEIERNEQELTRLYVSFLDGQRDFPEPILRKRQLELQQMVDNSVAFRAQLKEWLVEARDSLYQPCYELIDVALVKVCTEHSLLYAIDTDTKAYRYISPLNSVDITEMLISELRAVENNIGYAGSAESSVHQ